MNKTSSGRVISFDACWWLWMIECFKEMVDWYGYLCIMEYYYCFSLYQWRHYMFQCLIFYQDGYIEFRLICFWWMVREVIVSCNPAFSFGQYKIGCIRINWQYHITYIEVDKNIRIVSDIIKYLLALLFYELYTLSLGARYFINGWEKCIVESSSIIEKSF